jgi:hypothetical protein
MAKSMIKRRLGGLAEWEDVKIFCFAHARCTLLGKRRRSRAHSEKVRRVAPLEAAIVITALIVP